MLFEPPDGGILARQILLAQRTGRTPALVAELRPHQAAPSASKARKRGSGGADASSPELSPLLADTPSWILSSFWRPDRRCSLVTRRVRNRRLIQVIYLLAARPHEAGCHRARAGRHRADGR
jgi:hypothetical protein